MDAWERYLWVDEAIEAATLALVASAVPTAAELLARLGPVEPHGDMTYDAADAIQRTFYDDGSFDRRAVFQAGLLLGDGGDWWATVEPNGYRASGQNCLRTLATEDQAVSFSWNVNAVMTMLRVQDRRVVAAFDPLLDVDRVPEEGRDLPFGVEQPWASAWPSQSDGPA